MYVYIYIYIYIYIYNSLTRAQQSEATNASTYARGEARQTNRSPANRFRTKQTIQKHNALSGTRKLPRGFSNIVFHTRPNHKSPSIRIDI